jgi:hypothetical protein
MHLTLHDIPDPNIRAFLGFLRERRLDDIVIVGGAIRDVLRAQSPCKEIDIAVKLQVVAPEAVRKAQSNETYNMVPTLARALHPFAKVLGCEINAFYDPLPFEGAMIDMLGLIPVEDMSGQKYPDIFVDANGKLFNARPELTVNQLVLSNDGRIWPSLGIHDLNDHVARITKAPMGIHLRQVIRVLRTCKRFNLTLTQESATILSNHLRLLQELHRFQREITEEDTLSLIHDILDKANIKISSIDHLLILSKIESVLREYTKPWK